MSVEGSAADERPDEGSWRDVVESISTGVLVWDLRGRIRMANPEAGRLLGCEPHDLVGLDVRAFVPDTFHTETTEAHLALAVTRETFGVAEELVISRPDGSTLHVDVRLSLLHGDDEPLVVASATDARTRVPTEQARLDAGRRTILDSVPISILTTDADGVILSANAAAGTLLGVDPAELLERDLADLHDADELSAAGLDVPQARPEGDDTPSFAVLRTLADLEPGARREWTYVRPDGARVPVAEFLAPMGGDGTASGYLFAAYDNSQRVEASAEAERLARHDQLTGLPTRAFLVSVIDDILLRRPSAPLALMVLDVDHFKTVNDTLGHHVGDAVLRAVSERIREGAGPGAVTARIGGDAFATVVDVLDEPDAMSRARVIQERVATTDVDSDDLDLVGVSIGVALAGRDGADATELLKRADTAMYQAKVAGRNTIKVFVPSMDADREKLQLASGLRRAINESEVTVSYQPLVDLRTGNVAAFEALARWTSPRFGVVSPGRFIPLAEDHGLISDLGEKVLRTACAEVAELCRRLDRPVGLSVNVSPQQFRDRDLPGLVRQIAEQTGFDPTMLELEITENILVSDPMEVVDVMRAVRSLGVKIVIDDFGTGFSSLGYLTRLPIDKIKIDRSFVAKMDDNERDASIVESIILLAHTLGMAVVAEGIETPGQEQHLRGLGCDQGQGFLYSAAVPIAAASVLV